MYDNFLGVYSTWLKVESILKSKTDHLIRIDEPSQAELFNTKHLQLLVKDLELDRIPMGDLCPMCFTEGSERAFVCFDGNFQLTTLGTKLDIRDGVSTQDLDDKRLFVSQKPPVEVTLRVTSLIVAPRKTARMHAVQSSYRSESSIEKPGFGRYPIKLCKARVSSGGI